MHKYPNQFSGGQLQRICIARALAADPELIVLDEPLSSLDVSVQAQILNLLADLKQEKGLSYLLISHDLEAVYYLADTIYIMFRGQIVETLEKIEDLKELRHPYARRLLFADARKEYQMEDIFVDEEKEGKGCCYLRFCPMCEENCEKNRPLLREIAPGHLAACHKCIL